MWHDFSNLARINKCSGRFHPDIIGIAQSVGQTGTDRPSPITPIENLSAVHYAALSGSIWESSF